MLLHSYIFIAALFTSLIAVPGLRKWAFETGTLDLSDERKVHKGMMPRLGGVAIFLAFFISLLMFVDLTPVVRGILAGSLILFVTGLIDDLVGLSPKRKFCGEIFGTCVTIAISGLQISHLGNLYGTGEIILPLWLAVPFTVFAVVGVINAINLIDGLDGLSGGISIIALSGFTLLALLDSNVEVTLLCAALIGAVLGFLKYNAYPARIFMGDVGSLVVGFLLAFIAVHLTQRPGAGIQSIVPLLMLGVPIIDTIWVMGSRIARGVSPFVAEKTHVHHKLLDIGFQHKTSVLLIYAITLFWTFIAIFQRDQPAWQLLLFFALASFVGYQFLRFIAYHPEEFSCLAFYAPQSLLRTHIYLKIASLGKYLVVLLGGLLFTLLAVSLAAGCCLGASSVQYILLTLGVGVGLLLLIRDIRNHFFQIYLFVAGLVLSYEVTQAGANLLFSRYTLADVTNLLFLLMVPLVLFLVLFRNSDEARLTTQLDLLVLAVSLTLACVAQETVLSFSFPLLVSKAILIFLSIKILTHRSVYFSRPVCGSVLASLVFLFLQGFY